MAQEALHRWRLRQKQHGLSNSNSLSAVGDTQEPGGSDSIGTEDSNLHYYILPSQNTKIDLYAMLKSHARDPAYKVSGFASGRDIITKSM